MMFKWIAAWATTALMLTACGGGEDRTKAQVRLVNASSGYPSLDLIVDGQGRQAAVAYGATESYIEIDPGKTASNINSAGSSTALLSFTPSLSKSNHYTLLAWGVQGALKQLQLDEDLGAPDTNKTLLRIFNAAPDAGALDVYLTGSNDALASAVAVQSGAQVGVLGGYLTLTSATQRLRVTAAGSKTDVRLDVPALALASKQVATLVLAPASGGVLVNGLLITQQSSIVRQDMAYARVRAVAGMADGGSVSARVASNSLLTAVGSPAVALYSLVPAGTQSVVVGVNSNTLPSTVFTLAAGADYTLLVYGALSAPTASWIADDNHAPTDSTQARIRLVNGLATLATPLSMTANFVPVPDTAARGAASSYGSVKPTITGSLSVTAVNLSAPVYSATAQTFVAGAVYTLFVVGNDGSPTGILNQDR